MGLAAVPILRDGASIALTTLADLLQGVDQISRLRPLGDDLFLSSKQANCISSVPHHAGHLRMAKPPQTLPETHIRLFPPQASQPQASPGACPCAPSVGKPAAPRTRAGFLQESRASVRRAVVSLFLWTRLAWYVSFKFSLGRVPLTITIDRLPYIPIHITT